jgi:Cu/Ag efflux protein CusF
MEIEMKRILTSILLVIVVASFGLAAQNKTAPKGKKEFVFKGKVEKIDLSNKTFTVNGQNVEGWMAAMSMNYTPDKEDVLKRVKVGDEITAKVYDGDYRTLYDIQITPPKPADTKGGKK